MSTHLTRTTAVGLLACSVGFGAVACSGDPGPDPSADATRTTAPATEETATDPTGTSAGEASPPAAPFGPACASLPSVGDLGDQPLSSALRSVPQLSQLAGAVDTAGLGQRLDDLPAGTVFAPTDDAFGALAVSDLAGLLADPARLGQVLQYHVVPGSVAPEVVGTHQTLQGDTLVVEGSGDAYTVNGASILCGGIQADDSTVYVIDSLLTPPG